MRGLYPTVYTIDITRNVISRPVARDSSGASRDFTFFIWLQTKLYKETKVQACRCNGLGLWIIDDKWWSFDDYKLSLTSGTTFNDHDMLATLPGLHQLRYFLALKSTKTSRVMENKGNCRGVAMGCGFQETHIRFRDILYMLSLNPGWGVGLDALLC